MKKSPSPKRPLKRMTRAEMLKLFRRGKYVRIDALVDMGNGVPVEVIGLGDCSHLFMAGPDLAQRELPFD